MTEGVNHVEVPDAANKEFYFKLSLSNNTTVLPENYNSTRVSIETGHFSLTLRQDIYVSRIIHPLVRNLDIGGRIEIEKVTPPPPPHPRRVFYGTHVVLKINI